MINRYGYGAESFYCLFFFFLAIISIALESCYRKPKERKYIFLWCFFLLFFISGMRGITVGGDLKRYLAEFHWISGTSMREMWEYGHHEMGYMLYVKVLSFISTSDRMFLLGTSFASLLGPVYLFYKYSKHASVSVLLYYAMGYYSNTFNNVRQSIALSIIFCCIPFLINRKFLNYLIGVLFATTFHYSAIIMIVVYPLSSYIFDFKKLLIISGASLLSVFLLGYAALTFVSGYIERLDSEAFLEDGEGAGYGLFAFYAFIFLALSLYYLLKRNELSKEQQKLMSIFVLFQMFAMVFQLMAPIFPSMVRATFYFFIPIVTLAVPYVHSIISSKFGKYILYTMTFIFAVFYMVKVYSYNPLTYSNSQGTIPYIFIDKEYFEY